MDSLKIPGLSIAIINDGRIAYYRTFGVTNIDTKEKISAETLFDAGSISKTTFIPGKALHWKSPPNGRYTGKKKKRTNH